MATSGNQAENMEQEVDGNQEQKAGNKRKKKRGPERRNITLGGLKKVQTAMKRKAKNKMRKQLGQLKLPMGRKLKKKVDGSVAPIRSVMFVENTVGGELTRRLQESEMEAGKATGYRVRMAESAGTSLGMLLPSTTPWGPRIVAELIVYHVDKVMKED